ncbi:hypothetical protein SAMN05421820_101852 [Pedobacter steynii]|uniref:Uncharacterized protein n=1 Tax=Pedobacter steynii TaxID=430522 RepID=A0A1G9LDT1_9SPHI|nr:hypothetical protein SAMN05421820_101852 [Pedobacter steynii]
MGNIDIYSGKKFMQVNHHGLMKILTENLNCQI